MTSKTYFAPGRVNLIGEHIDYNGGLVLPAALTIGIKATVAPRNDDKIVLRSATHNLQTETPLNQPIQYNGSNDWANYPLGVIARLIEDGCPVTGCEINFESNLPESSGLSSSAAIEVLTGYLFLKEAGKEVDMPKLAVLCKEVENKFIGVQCGIMDQFIIAVGRHDNAVLLNCATLDFEYVPFNLTDYCLLIINSKKPRSLIKSKYNERKSECDAALATLQAAFDVKDLCSASMQQLEIIKDETLKKRARHAITENLRVKETLKALRFNDLSTFGRLMNASHASLRNDFEITGPEINAIVDTAQQLKGCLGARMTGGNGFGGCAIALVHKNAVNEFNQILSARYAAATGLNCEIYRSEIGTGVRELNNA